MDSHPLVLHGDSTQTAETYSQQCICCQNPASFVHSLCFLARIRWYHGSCCLPLINAVFWCWDWSQLLSISDWCLVLFPFNISNLTCKHLEHEQHAFFPALKGLRWLCFIISSNKRPSMSQSAVPSFLIDKWCAYKDYASIDQVHNGLHALLWTKNMPYCLPPCYVIITTFTRLPKWCTAILAKCLTSNRNCIVLLFLSQYMITRGP